MSISKISIYSSPAKWPYLSRIIQLTFLGLLLNTLSPLSSFAQAEALTYHILNGKKNMGSLVTSRVEQDNIVTYHSTSKIVTSFIKEFRIVFDYHVQFKNNQLIHSESQISINEKVKEKTYINWTGDHYKIVDKDGQQSIHQQPIYYSTVLLYFQEPATRPSVFSELDGSYHPLKLVGNRRYQKTTPKGKTNYYEYQNGTMERAELDGGLINFQIVLSDSK